MSKLLVFPGRELHQKLLAKSEPKPPG